MALNRDDFMARYSRLRALRHHAGGIFLAERMFGVMLSNADGRIVPAEFQAPAAPEDAP